MQEAWIQVQCPDCTTEWEASVNELPPSGQQFQCDSCESDHPMAEFTKTARDLEVLRSMNAGE